MNKMKKFGLWIGATMMVMPMIVSAGVLDEPIAGKSFSSMKTVDDLYAQVEKGINYFLAFVLLIGVIMIIYGGMQHFIADKPEDARKVVTNGIIGVVIAVSAYSIVAMIGAFLK